MRNTTSLFFAIAALSTTASAALIDFETTPTGLTPTDNAPIVGAYVDGATSIMFGFDLDGDDSIDSPARFESRSDPLSSVTAYTSGGFQGDPLIPDPDFTMTGEGGDWLLRPERSSEGTNVQLDVNPFIVEYAGVLPTSASGQIWDIDGVEGYTVEALDETGALIDSIVSPLGLPETDPNSLNGLPWTFSFNNLSSPIATIKIFQSNGTPFGFGFDNFDATRPAAPMPVPATLALLAIGLCCMGFRRR